VAPGVSAPSAAGIGWPNFFPLLRKVFESRKVVSMDIAELNPRYDLDNRTAKLAAAIAFEMVYLMSRGQIE
jgi:formiminoglutamase